MTLEEWHTASPQGDELLACIGSLAAQYERPSSPASIRAGLALDEAGLLPFHQAENALDRIGLRGQATARRLRGWRDRDLPAILFAGAGKALVLHGVNGKDCEVQLPGRTDRVWVSRSALESVYAGQALIVDPDPGRDREGERPWEAARRNHWFWHEVWKVRKSFLYVMLAALVINLLAFALPLFTMNVYDRIIPNKSATSLWVLAFGVLIAISVEFGLRLARTRLVDELGRSLDARLSQRLFEKVLNLPMSERKGSTGALARRVTDYEMVRDFFASTTVVLIVDILFLFVFVALIAVLAGWLAMIPIVAMAIMAGAGFLLQKSMGQAAQDAQADSSLQQSALIESIGGIETLKACRAEGRMLGRWQRYAAASAQTQERLRNLTATAVNLAAFCQQATNVALVIGGFYLFNSGSISMGGIIAIVMLAGRSLAPVGQLAFLMTRGRQAFTTLASLQTMMEQGDEREKGSRSVVPEIAKGLVELDHVSFAYPQAGKESLSDISLKIQPGERIGLIGRVASGKSTLGRLICGLYEPSEGSYRIDGLDSRQHHPHELRAALRFVGQDAELFSGTVRENLLLGARELDEDRLLAAVAASGADGFIGRDAAGFDLHIGERGSRLSGGQRSFMVLARALVEPCKLLFLDEPTGAMDTQTERLFIDRLAKAITPDQTVIISTHRNAMLSIVDRLIVIDQGRIIADGPRDQILAKAGLAGE
ncbi:MAG: type I secretion system permease/ATPase [Sphingorhabdus sp.]